MFTEVGEYAINYKITCDKCSDLTGSNKVKIYGIERIDDSLEIKDNVLVVRTSNNEFDSVSSLIKVFAKNYSYEHYDKNNNLDDSNVVKTGDKIRIIINDNNIIEYNISIIGDVTGDGIVNIADVIKIADHSIQQDILIEDYEIVGRAVYYF